MLSMRRYRDELGACLLLAILTLAAYAGVMTSDFINYDDPRYVSQNPQVQQGLTASGIQYAWTTFDSGNYHPLTWLSLEIDASLFGLEAAGFHITNLAFHVVNSVLLLIVMRRMTGRLWPSAAVAALFALHPMHVESVAWISERKDVLSAFFLMLTLLAYEAHAAQPSPARYALVFVLMGLGLLAKPMLVSLPVLLLLLDFWPLRRVQSSSSSPAPRYPQRRFGALALEKLPLFALTAASCVVTLIAQRSAEAYESLARLPLATRIGHALYADAWYLGKSFWPTNLSVLYLHPLQKFFAAMAAVGLIVVGGVSLIAIWPTRARGPLAVGWLWFLGALLPVIGIVQVGLQAYADRYVYVPHIGLFVMVVFGACELLGDRRAGRAALAITAGALAVACLGLTRWQVAYWRDTESLWRHALACSPDNWMAHLSLGDLRSHQGRWEEAVEHFTALVREKPGHADFRFRLGSALHALSRFPEAEQQYAAALQSNPEHGAARKMLISLYKTQGKLQFDAADAASRNRFGLALARLGETEEAVGHFSAAVERNPEFVEAHNNLALALSQLDRNAEAKEHLLRALQLAPEFASAHFNLAVLLQREGDLAAAKEHFGAAVRLNPDDAEARARLVELQRGP